MAKIVLHAIKSVEFTAKDLARFNTPVISNRNRLEGVPRTEDFDRGLRAEIHDPLWMLSRQWQMGEFEGEDRGAAVTVQVKANHGPVQTLTRPESAAHGEITLAKNMAPACPPLHLVRWDD